MEVEPIPDHQDLRRCQLAGEIAEECAHEPCSDIVGHGTRIIQGQLTADTRVMGSAPCGGGGGGGGSCHVTCQLNGNQVLCNYMQPIYLACMSLAQGSVYQCGSC